MSTLVRKRALV